MISEVCPITLHIKTILKQSIPIYTFYPTGKNGYRFFVTVFSLLDIFFTKGYGLFVYDYFVLTEIVSRIIIRFEILGWLANILETSFESSPSDIF